MDVVLVVACGMAVGSTVVASLWPTLTTALLTAVVLAGRGRRVQVVFLLAAMAGGLLAARAVQRYESVRQASAPAVSGLERCEVDGTVVSSPVVVRGTPRFDVELTRSDCALRGRITLYGGFPELARGDIVTGFMQVGVPDRFADPELGDAFVRESHRGVVRTGSAIYIHRLHKGWSPLAIIDHLRAHTRERIEATFPEATAGLARALVLGEGDLDPVDDDAFRASGLAHLLAVSGMHLVLVVVGAVAAMRSLLLRVTPLSERFDVGRIAAAIGVPFCWAYADFAGGSGSALRAAWMLTAALCARALARRTTAVRTLALSVLGAIAFDALTVFDASFMLSACATAGLIAFSRPLGALLTSRAPRWAHGVLRQVATTLAATIPCAPVLATFAPALPLGSVVANLLAVPFGEAAALPLCLLHALMSPVPTAERGCALAASGALLAVRSIARGFASVHVLSVPVPMPSAWQLAFVTLAFAAMVWAKRRRRELVIGAIAIAALVEVPLRASAAPRGHLRATFLDVGQGDSALLDLPDGSAMLIDGGGLVGSPLDVGKRVLSPVLRARRRSGLRLVVLTHPHPDHFGGLESGLASVHVDEMWDTGQGEREGVLGGYASTLSFLRQQGTLVRRPSEVCGSHTIGGARIDVLAPCPDELPDRTPNDNSFVLRVSYGQRALLFEGDAEREEEAELVARYGVALHADVLKVGHHGSRTSSTHAMLAAVSPSVAVISCGIRNHYGHPVPSTLVALRQVAGRVLRTDHAGAVTVTTDGSSLIVDEAIEEP